MTQSMTINGQLRAAAKTRDVPNPATGGIVGQMPLATPADLDDAVAAAKAAFVKWSATPDDVRVKACVDIADVLHANAEELAQLLTREQGKPLGGLGSRFELGGAEGWARYTAGLELKPKILQDNQDGKVELFRKPIGVVGSITPWNWPLMIAIWHIVPALRTGNTVVIKPSPYTPLSTLRMVELLNTVLPPGVLNCVTGEDSIGALMSAHKDIGKMVFTGSTATGKKVMASAAGTLKRLTLELGGNDAGIVLPDAKPASIVEGIFWGAFINNGQTCGALKRLYVHDSIHDELCAALVDYASKIPVGDGLDERSVLGPIQNRMQFDKVSRLVEDAKARGGQVLLGGQAPEKGLFYPLTIIAGLTNGIALVDEEQFGPVLPIIRYSNVEDAIAMANDNPNGLDASVWSNDIAAAKAIAARMESGTTWINKHAAIQPNAPMGGVKSSGIGVEFGEEGLAEYTTIQVAFS